MSSPASAAAAMCIGALRIISPLPFLYVFIALYLHNQHNYITTIDIMTSTTANLQSTVCYCREQNQFSVQLYLRHLFNKHEQESPLLQGNRTMPL